MCPKPAPILLLVILAVAAPTLAREHAPAPAGGGPGVHLYRADQANPLDLPAPGPYQHPRDLFYAQPKSGARYDDIGGDDVEIITVDDAYQEDLAISSSGDLFAIIKYERDDDGAYRFVVRRSDDGGTTWRDWANFEGPTLGHRYWRPEIHVAEGAEDRVFVVYSLDPGSGPWEVHVAWSPLDLENGDFSNDTTNFTAPTGYIINPSLATDAATWSDYFTYLTFSADNGDGNDIYFARSTDQGTTWEAPYVIAAISVSDRGYHQPRVAVGYGGWVHVAWYLGFDSEHEFDNTIRYRRAVNYAGGGLDSWENMQSLTPHTDDVDVFYTRLSASMVSSDVMMAFTRRLRNPDGTGTWAGTGTLSSTDSGASWSGMTEFGSGIDWLGDLLYQEVNDRWLLGFTESGQWGFRWAPTASPADWSELVVFADKFYQSGAPSLAIDPTHDHRIGIVGGGRNEDDTFTYYFDAEWRADPGYPNLEPGFPVDLAAQPISDPAIVDLDGDGDLEIVFSDAADRIQVYRCDGTPLPGWPVQVSTQLSDSPVAIGDLNGNGELSVVIGTTNGLIAAYDAGGTLMQGWPSYVGVEAPVYLAIGAVGGPYPRAVIAGAGGALGYWDWHGERYPGAVHRGWTSRTISSAPAVGDLDGDGDNEVVVAASGSVYAFPMDDYGWNIFLDLEDQVTGGVTLGDFDLDGNVEVVVPLANGVVHLLEGDGSEFPGDWPVTVADSELNGAAIARCLGTFEPEITVTARNWLVSLLWYDGAVGAGWPENTDGWYLHGKPVMGRVDGSSSDVIVGARGSKGWAWSNTSALIPGWPKALENHVYQTPAYGDLDLDGNAEIVFLTLDQLVVVDVGNTTSEPSRTWAMAGHDPERTGCANCPEHVVAVENAPTGVTRVSMAAPWPNPIAGQATFAYAVPVRARVELVIYDVRGRRVATVHRAEETAGQHVITWSGRDGDGRPVASGQYVAALKVTGPGVDETISRKVTVLR